jgi:hypothetical protein
MRCDRAGVGGDYAAAGGAKTEMQPCSAPSPEGLGGAGVCVAGVAGTVVVEGTVVAGDLV